MIRDRPWTPAACWLLLLILGCAHGLPEVTRAQQGSPERARLITEDIDRFWTAFDAAGPDYSPETFQRLYLDPATPGLEDFVRLRIESADSLAATVRRHPLYYASIRASTARVGEMETRIRRGFHALEELYPGAIFPDVYFLIGRMNSGGTTSERGLLIGVEMYGLTPDAPREELGEWHRQVLRDIEVLPDIVLHELIHFQQSYPSAPPTLLSQSIREGVADLVSEKLSGRHINAHIHAWADPRERELWEQFHERMHGEDFSGWLYDGDGAEGRPADLGYWMGARIAEAYWEKVGDPERAIHDLFHIEDFKAFLEASGYPERWGAER